MRRKPIRAKVFHAMTHSQPFSQLTAGMPLLTPQGQLIALPEKIARQFRPGDSIAALPNGELLHIPAGEKQIATDAVTSAVQAFSAMGSVSDAQLITFYRHVAAALKDDAIWRRITEVNAADVAAAQARGRSTTRLVATETLRNNIIAGLLAWIDAPSMRGQIVQTVNQEEFRVELVGAALGVVAFVFEGRPNVLVDACGVLRSGNTTVLRIGSDALNTAKALMQWAITPALTASGLPEGAVTLVESASHAAAWALFSDQRLSLAIARGSGPAVETLGALARSAGVPVSLHGTGGAWMVAAESADSDIFAQAVINSLDRKVCNTLNTCCIVSSQATRLVPLLLASAAEAGRRRGQDFKLHVAEGSEKYLSQEYFQQKVSISRAHGSTLEPQVELLPIDLLGKEWEWEETPEITLVVVASTDEAVALFNRYSPLFVAALISSDSAKHEHFYQTVNAPFVSNGYTRWVDGQFALHKPELGLSNWQHGRLFGRGGILCGDSAHTLRTRYIRE